MSKRGEPSSSAEGDSSKRVRTERPPRPKNPDYRGIQNMMDIKIACTNPAMDRNTGRPTEPQEECGTVKQLYEIDQYGYRCWTCAGKLEEIVYAQTLATQKALLHERRMRKGIQLPEDAESLEELINDLAELKSRERSDGQSNRALPSLSRKGGEEVEAPEITVQCPRRARKTGSDSRECKTYSSIDQLRQNQYKCSNPVCKFDMRKAAKNAVERRIRVYRKIYFLSGDVWDKYLMGMKQLQGEIQDESAALGPEPDSSSGSEVGTTDGAQPGDGLERRR